MSRTTFARMLLRSAADSLRLVALLSGAFRK